MTVATFKQPDYASMSDSSEYPLAIDASIAVLAEYAAGFAVHERAPADFQVTMDAGKVSEGQIPIIVAAQDSAVLSPPSGNPRNDIVYLADDNLIGVAEGVEAGAPEDPTIPGGAVAMARIRWTPGAPAITNDMLDDLRLAGGGGGNVDNLIPGGQAFNANTVDFGPYDFSPYSKVSLIVTGISSDDLNWSLRMRVGEGSIDAGNNYFLGFYRKQIGGPLANSSSSNGANVWTIGAANAPSMPPMHLEVQLFDPTANDETQMNFMATDWNEGGTPQGQCGLVAWGRHAIAAQLNLLQLFSNQAGNMVGVAHLYGTRK